jgi:hypothetical protein
MPHHGEQDPRGVDHAVPLAPQQRFRPVNTAPAARARRARVAGTDRGAGGRVAAGVQPSQLAHLGMDAGPGPIAAPLPKGGGDGAPCAVLAGELAPRTAATPHVEAAIADAPYIGRPRAAARFGGGDQGSEQRPLGIGAIARGHWTGPTGDGGCPVRTLRNTPFGQGIS